MDAASAGYRARVEEIVPLLPPAMLRLARGISLHDGLIEQVIWNPALKRLRLSLLCGDLQQGYFQVQLAYDGASCRADRIRLLLRIALSRETELLRHEVDIDGDHFAHRLLFAPYGEFSIYFKELELVVSPRTDRWVHFTGAFVDDTADDETLD